MNATLKAIANIINEQPTAYDMDKVVEELEEESKIALEINESCMYAAFQRAIEIVKQGGVGKDVSE